MKTAVFDFDGVIATYNGWKGFDVLGEPQLVVISCMKDLKALGWRIVIWTTRPATPKLIEWLKHNEVPYDDINRNGHNPIMTSGKPIYHVIVDDRAVRYWGQDARILFANIMEVVKENENKQ
jgi:hypothetical protein